jgi:hypothetical protein
MSEDEVVVVVDAEAEVIEVTVDGEQGPPGPPGGVGPSGALVKWFGNGPPGLIIGAEPNDLYLDLDTGDIYTLS